MIPSLPAAAASEYRRKEFLVALAAISACIMVPANFPGVAELNTTKIVNELGFAPLFVARIPLGNVIPPGMPIGSAVILTDPIAVPTLVAA